MARKTTGSRSRRGAPTTRLSRMIPANEKRGRTELNGWTSRIHLALTDFIAGYFAAVNIKICGEVLRRVGNCRHGKQRRTEARKEKTRQEEVSGYSEFLTNMSRAMPGKRGLGVFAERTTHGFRNRRRHLFQGFAAQVLNGFADVMLSSPCAVAAVARDGDDLSSKP
jgi:hypothetical protein